MSARQTVLRVRGDGTALSAEVASLLPSQIGRARRSIARTTSRGVRTTFCPICGGDKLPRSSRCADCRNRAMRGTRGFAGAAKSLVGEAVIRDNPDHGDFQPQAPTRRRRVRGEGRVVIQAWDRKVLVDGQWMPESQTPEGIERRTTDDDAVRRLQKEP